MSDEMNQEDKPDLSPYRKAAEAILTQAWGGAVRLEDGVSLREHGRNRVLRCPIAEKPAGAPPVTSVIVKSSVGETDGTYDAQDMTDGGAAWRFSNEWAGTDFLTSLDVSPPLGARLYGGDKAAGVFVIEDLGDGGCLADRMQAEDLSGLDAALMAYARGMGRLHAATAGREAEFGERRLALVGDEPASEREGTQWVHDVIPAFQEQCASLGVTLADGFADEIAQIQAILDEPGPFLAFAPGDTCPDNHRLIGDDGIRFFDFEFCGFRHALLDAAYLHMPFPTCWCVNRLPSDRVRLLEKAYRLELITGCPEAESDAVFYPAMVAACAYWTIASLGWTLEGALKEDGQWGISTHRQRHPMRLANFAALAEENNVFPALAATARALEAKLVSLWPETEAMPLYPAFRA